MGINCNWDSNSKGCAALAADNGGWISACLIGFCDWEGGSSQVVTGYPRRKGDIFGIG